VTEFPIPTADSGPRHIAAGPDGALWFTEFFGNKIGRITAAGSITEFPLPSPFRGPFGITAGPDGALWFTESGLPGGNKIGRLTTAGSLSEFLIPTPDSSPAGIAAGPDGALWFTELLANKIGRAALEPTSKDECKRGGWRQFGFRNQGQCVSFVQRGPNP
jgi:virginiamycin B lyase